MFDLKKIRWIGMSITLIAQTIIFFRPQLGGEWIKSAVVFFEKNVLVLISFALVFTLVIVL